MKKVLLTILAVCLASCSSTQTPTPVHEMGDRPAVPNDICDQLQAGATPESTVPVIPVDGTLRVLAFGDFGTGNDTQRRVARGIDRQKPYHFGITLGDNFYRQGLSSPTHRRWQTDWEDLYSPLDIRVYATLGNHDYLNSRSPAAEQARSSLSRTWCLPRPSYTFIAGPVQFFAVDTDPIDKEVGDREIEWLRRALASSQAPWKVVYGHHPVYTNGDHGGNRGFLPELREQLLPVLQQEGHKADVYIAGHDHDLQALKPDGGVWFFVSGGGGQDTRPLRTEQCRQWAESMNGFTVLEADEETLAISFFDENGAPVPGSRVELKKGSTTPDCAR